jgi:predicted Fe-S protein YdhL (DUF1289 family)
VSKQNTSNSSQSASLQSAHLQVKSPCINICCLDDENVCSGCYRTGDEIMQWGRATNEERKNIMKNVAERELNSGNIMKL